jgi:hypothetical protein
MEIYRADGARIDYWRGSSGCLATLSQLAGPKSNNLIMGAHGAIANLDIVKFN